MRYTYDCTHPDCGATVTLFRSVAARNNPASCPASSRHRMVRRAVEGVPAIAVVGGTRGVGWQEKINRQYRNSQIKQTMEETF